MIKLAVTTIATFGATLAIVVSLAPDARADDLQDLEKVVEWARPVFGSSCDFPEFSDHKDILKKNAVYEIDYKPEGASEGDEPQTFVLYEIHCFSGATNWDKVYITRNMDGDYQALTFAEPKYKLEYADSPQNTKLKSPPKFGLLPVSWTLS